MVLGYLPASWKIRWNKMHVAARRSRHPGVITSYSHHRSLNLKEADSPFSSHNRKSSRFEGSIATLSSSFFAFIMEPISSHVYRLPAHEDLVEWDYNPFQARNSWLKFFQRRPCPPISCNNQNMPDSILGNHPALFLNCQRFWWEPFCQGDPAAQSVIFMPASSLD